MYKMESSGLWHEVGWDRARVACSALPARSSQHHDAGRDVRAAAPDSIASIHTGRRQDEPQSKSIVDIRPERCLALGWQIIRNTATRLTQKTRDAFDRSSTP